MRILYSLLGVALFVGALMFNVSSTNDTTDDQFSSALTLMELEENVVLGQTECTDPGTFCQNPAWGNYYNSSVIEYNWGGFITRNCCYYSIGSCCSYSNSCAG